MSTFTLHLQSAAACQSVEGVSSFVGEDAEGAFGILAEHERFMTPLAAGLARFRRGNGPWQYLGTTGGIAYFLDGALFINTRRFLIDTDFERISTLLGRQLAEEERVSRQILDSLRRIEESMLHRLLQLGRTETPGP